MVRTAVAVTANRQRRPDVVAHLEMRAPALIHDRLDWLKVVLRCHVLLPVDAVIASHALARLIMTVARRARALSSASSPRLLV